MNFEILNSNIKSCQLCEGLNQDATATSEATLNAPGYGDRSSPIVFIGQSLCGEPCIKSGIPFTGGSGELLDEAFRQSGIEKNQIYITNVVKCHPPGNRKSEVLEKDNCRPYLDQEMSYLSPKSIICMGGDARDYFNPKAKFKTSESISLANQSVNVSYLYHPSYIMQYAKEQKAQYIDSMVEIISEYF